MSHSPLAVANKILDVAAEKGVSLTLMQLIKLVYFAHGWTLALLDKALVHDEPQAWQHGPVYPEIYSEFRGSGWNPITRRAVNPFTGTDIAEKFDGSELAVIRKVVDVYGEFHAFEMSEITHRKGSPWDKAYNGGNGKSSHISDSEIKAHFAALRKPKN